MEAEIKWLDDPEIFQVGRINAHSDHRFFVNDEEMGNSPEKEFRVMIVKMTQDLGKRMEAPIKKL